MEGTLQKLVAPCLRCNKEVEGFLIPDGRFICPNCDPPAVFERWKRTWEPHEKAYLKQQAADAKAEEAERRKAAEQVKVEQQEHQKSEATKSPKLAIAIAVIVIGCAFWMAPKFWNSPPEIKPAVQSTDVSANGGGGEKTESKSAETKQNDEHPADAQTSGRPPVVYKESPTTEDAAVKQFALRQYRKAKAEDIYDRTLCLDGKQHHHFMLALGKEMLPDSKNPFSWQQEIISQQQKEGLDISVYDTRIGRRHIFVDMILKNLNADPSMSKRLEDACQKDSISDIFSAALQSSAPDKRAYDAMPAEQQRIFQEMVNAYDPNQSQESDRQRDTLRNEIRSSDHTPRDDAYSRMNGIQPPTEEEIAAREAKWRDEDKEMNRKKEKMKQNVAAMQTWWK